MEIKFLDKSNPLTPDLLSKLEEFDSEGISEYVTDPFTFEVAVVYNEDTPIAIGLLRVVEEYKIALDSNLSNNNKAMIVKAFLGEAKKRSKCNEAIVFVTKDKERFERFLKKHFKFKNREGIPLTLEG